MTKETQTNVSQNEERKMYALQTGETETNVVFEVEDSKHAKKGESSPKRLTLGTQGDKANANIYLVSWFLLNVGITLYCKAAFSFYKFPYPVIMTAIHVTFTYIGVWICARVGLYKPAPISRETFGSLLWFSVVFTVNIWLSNASLLKASIALHQVTRTTIPLFTMVTSALLFREIYPWSLLPSVIMVIAGVACTVWGDIGFEWMGMMLVLFGCFFSSLKGILTQKVVRNGPMGGRGILIVQLVSCRGHDAVVRSCLLYVHRHKLESLVYPLWMCYGSHAPLLQSNCCFWAFLMVKLQVFWQKGCCLLLCIVISLFWESSLLELILPASELPLL
eukprot:Selendium_serpulae@DN3968_c0_g1_i5.p1